MGEFFNDGMWPLPYIGAAILTPLSLWFIGSPITILNFAILFFVSFATFYFILAFFGHHYVNFVVDYTTDYIRGTLNQPITTKPQVTTSSQQESQIEKPQTEKPQIEKPYTDVASQKVAINRDSYDTSYNDDGQVCINPESSRSDKSGFRSFTSGDHVTFATSIY